MNTRMHVSPLIQIGTFFHALLVIIAMSGSCVAHAQDLVTESRAKSALGVANEQIDYARSLPSGSEPYFEALKRAESSLENDSLILLSNQSEQFRNEVRNASEAIADLSSVEAPMQTEKAKRPSNVGIPVPSDKVRGLEPAVVAPQSGSDEREVRGGSVKDREHAKLNEAEPLETEATPSPEKAPEAKQQGSGLWKALLKLALVALPILALAMYDAKKVAPSGPRSYIVKDVGGVVGSLVLVVLGAFIFLFVNFGGQSSGLIKLAAITVGVGAYFRYRVIKDGITFDLDAGIMSYPGGGVALNNLSDVLNPKFILQYFQRFFIKMNEIRSMSDGEKMKISKEGHASYSYYIEVNGAFGASRISFGGNKLKMDEAYSFIRQYNRMGEPIIFG